MAGKKRARTREDERARSGGHGGGGEEEDGEGVVISAGEILKFSEEGKHVELAKSLSDVVGRGGEGEEDARTMERLREMVNTRNDEDETALHLACLYGHEGCVKLLIGAGADVRVCDEDGATPLHDAAAGGYTKIVRLMLEQLDDERERRTLVNTKDEDGDTPLHAAARGNHDETCVVLEACGADLDTQNSDGAVPWKLVELKEVPRETLISSVSQTFRQAREANSMS